MRLLGRHAELVITIALACAVLGARLFLYPRGPTFLILYYIILTFAFLYWIFWTPREDARP